MNSILAPRIAMRVALALVLEKYALIFITHQIETASVHRYCHRAYNYKAFAMHAMTLSEINQTTIGADGAKLSHLITENYWFRTCILLFKRNVLNAEVSM